MAREGPGKGLYIVQLKILTGGSYQVGISHSSPTGVFASIVKFKTCTGE